MIENQKNYFLKEALPVFFVFFALYAFCISGVLAISHDSILITQNIVHSKHYFHPHHLLYYHTVWLWSKLLSIFEMAPSTVFASINSFFGAMIQVVIFFIMRQRLGLTKPLAFAATSIPALSYGLWFYSTCIEVYIIPLFFILLTFYAITSENKNKYIFAGIFHGLSILYHQTHIFLFIPILMYIFVIDRKEINSLKIQFIKYFFLTTLIVIIPYLLVMIFDKNLSTFSEMWRFLTFYAGDLDKTNWWHDISLKTIPMVLVGFSRAMLTSHYLFASSFGANLIAKVFPNNYFADETYLVRDLPEVVSFFLLFLTLILVLFVIFTLLKNLMHIRTIITENKKIMIFVSFQLITYSIFFTFWDSGNQEFWIPQSVFFWLGFIIIIKSSSFRKNINAIIPYIAISLFLINFIGSIYFSRNNENDFYFTSLKPLTSLAKKGDLIVIEDNYYAKEYLIFMTKSEIVLLSEHFYEYRGESIFVDTYKEIIDKKLKSTGRIFIIKQTPKRTFNATQKELVLRFWKDYQPNIKKLFKNNNGFYELKRQ